MTQKSQENQESTVFQTGTFNFSGANINNLESSEYTLVGIAVDSSISVRPFADDINKCVKEVVESCQKSPRSDNLMLRVVTFSNQVAEFHGFQELNKCDLSRYADVVCRFGNATSLYDATINVIESVNKYGQELADNDYAVNGIVFIITDGIDNNSTYTPKNVKEKLMEGVGEQKLESLISILMGVNIQDSVASNMLANFQKTADLSSYIQIKEADSKTLAKLAQFISKSISNHSQSLGSGGNSPSLSF